MTTLIPRLLFVPPFAVVDFDAFGLPLFPVPAPFVPLLPLVMIKFDGELLPDIVDGEHER